MFQTLERKHTASPSAMSSSGVALTMSSPKAYCDLIGSQKNTWQALHRVFAQRHEQGDTDEHRHGQRQQRRAVSPQARSLGRVPA